MASPGYQYCASCIGILPCYFAPVGEQSMVMIFDFRCFVSPRERKTFIREKNANNFTIQYRLTRTAVEVWVS